MSCGQVPGQSARGTRMPPCLPLSMAPFLYYGDGDQQPVRAGCKMTEKGDRFPAANNDGIGQRGGHSTVPRIGGAGANDGPNWTPLPRARSSSACPNGNAVRSRRLLVSRRQECSAGAAPTVFAAVRLQALLDHRSVDERPSYLGHAMGKLGLLRRRVGILGASEGGSRRE